MVAKALLVEHALRLVGLGLVLGGAVLGPTELARRRVEVLASARRCGDGRVLEALGEGGVDAAEELRQRGAAWLEPAGALRGQLQREGDAINFGQFLKGLTPKPDATDWEECRES